MLRSLNNQTGTFFDDQTPEVLADCILRFNSAEIDPAACRRQAAKFDVDIFKKNIQPVLASK